MQYNVEEAGTLKKMVEVIVPAADGDVIIGRVIDKFRISANIPGFRKGKAPLGMVEKQFRKDIYDEATSFLVDSQVRSIIAELKLDPASQVEYEAETIVKGKDYKYSFSFEYLPDFELPPYADLPVEEEKAAVEDREIDEVLEKARNDFAKLVPVSEIRKPQDGDIVTLDFAGFDEEGKEMPGIKAENIQMPIGAGQAIEDFEKLIKTVAPGESGEGKVVFPDDFPNKELAAKTMHVKLKVHVINERELPDLDDAFAARLGHFSGLDEVRVAIRTSFMRSRMQTAKTVTKNKLLGALLEKVNFPLPEGMVERFVQAAVAQAQEKMRRQGQAGEIFGADAERIKADARMEAEKYVRSYIFLNRIGKVEAITVSEEEVIRQLQQIAQQAGRDFADVRDEYARNNMIGTVHDRLMADKALQAIYDKARVTYVSPSPEKTEQDADPKKNFRKSTAKSVMAVSTEAEEAAQSPAQKSKAIVKNAKRADSGKS